jgi:hypothetical protein
MAHKDFIELADGIIVNLQNIRHIMDKGDSVEVYFIGDLDEDNNPVTFPVSYQELKKKLLE